MQTHTPPPTQREVGDDLSDRDTAELCRFIYQRAGIVLTPDKRSFFLARIGKRVRALKLNSYRKYMDVLKQDTTGEEVSALIDVLSTHWTAFFRENDHFVFLREKVLEPLMQAGRPIRLWSGAASTGQEATSMGIEVMETAQRLNARPDVQITGTDVSEGSLDIGRRGLYRVEALAGVSDERKKRWFQRGVGAYQGWARVRPEVHKLIQYHRMNLLEDAAPASDFDVIFLRNVMIYFDRPTQQRLVARMIEHLKPGGYFIVGRAESLVGLKHPMSTVQAAVYQLGRAA